MKEQQKRVFFGYDQNTNGKFIIWEEQADVVKYIYSIYACGYSLAFIADGLAKLKIPSPTNKQVWGRQIINNVLSNEKYLGDSDYPQVVEPELFAEVQARKNSNTYSLRYKDKYGFLYNSNARELQISD